MTGTRVRNSYAIAFPFADSHQTLHEEKKLQSFNPHDWPIHDDREKERERRKGSRNYLNHDLKRSLAFSFCFQREFSATPFPAHPYLAMIVPTTIWRLCHFIQQIMPSGRFKIAMNTLSFLQIHLIHGRTVGTKMRGRCELRMWSPSPLEWVREEAKHRTKW